MWDFRCLAMLLRPIVLHGIREIGRYDRRTVHTLYETAITSYLVAMGYSPQMAIRMFEQYEKMYGGLEMYEGEEFYRSL
jgi:hypothetical protein